MPALAPPIRPFRSRRAVQFPHAILLHARWPNLPYIRRRQRLDGYDYATHGVYSVTLCIQNRLPLLGVITSDQMQFSEAGEMVQQIWEGVPDRYPDIVLDTLMVMPDYVHAIIVLPGDGLCLSDLDHHLKAHTTAQYALAVRRSSWPPFSGRLWQRGFYDRVIRGDKELNQTREYTGQNLLRWSLARE